jgi:hypothetical protein
LLTIGTLFYAPLRQAIDYPGAIHWHLPTFLHVVFLSWVTVLWGGVRGPGRWQVPLFWSIINMAFEGIQFWLRPNYGTYDPLDILAAGLGGLVAYLGISKLKLSEYRRVASFAVGIYGCLILTATQCGEEKHLVPDLSAEEQFDQSNIPNSDSYTQVQDRRFDHTDKLTLYENTLVSATAEGQVSIWDVTIKDRLELLGTCDCFGPTVDIFAKDGILVALGPAETGASLIDLSIPESPVLISTIAGSFSGGLLDDGLLFLASDQQLYIYDLGVKEEPSLLSTYNSDAALLGAALAFKAPRLYVGAKDAFGDGEFYILSLSEENVLSLEGRGYGPRILGSLSLDGDLLFLNSFDATFSNIFDVSDPAYPRQLDSLRRAPGGLPLYAREGFVFLPNQRSFWIAKYEVESNREQSGVRLSPSVRFEPDQEILDFAVGEDYVYLLLKEDEIARSIVALPIEQNL